MSIPLVRPARSSPAKLLALALTVLVAAVPCRAAVPPWMLGDEQTMKCYFLNKTEIATPPHVRLSWTSAPPATMYDDAAANVSYTVEIDAAFWTSAEAAALLQGDLAHWQSLCEASNTQCSASASSNCCVFHSNLHSCRSNTGVCSPWVKPQNCSAGGTCEAGVQLVTHTAAKVGGAEQYSHGLRLQHGSWVVIAHTKIMNFQCAVGATRTVHQRSLEASAHAWVLPLVIAFVCVLVLIGVVNGYQYTRGRLLTVPLQRLAHRMTMTASLQDDDEDDDPSALAEVAEMQAAYGKMKAELNRMRSFLPQSVLNDDDEDEDAEEGSRIDENSMSKISGSVNNAQGDRSTIQSKRSSVSSRRSRANGCIVGLKLSSTVSRKRVAVAAFNTVGFHDLLTTQSHAQPRIRDAQEALLKAVLPAVSENKGVVDVFNGDHVVVSFNAVNNVGQCSKRAVQAAMQAAKTLSGDASMGRLSVGVATGSACVGNMGVDGMQRFNIIGGVYVEALAMERYGRRALDEDADKSPLVDGVRAPWVLHATHGALADLLLEYEVEYVDWVRVGLRSARAVGRVVKPKQMAMDEWMYQVQESENEDPNTASNSAFEALVARNGTGVEEIIATGAVPAGKRAVLEAVLAAGIEESAATVVGLY